MKRSRRAGVEDLWTKTVVRDGATEKQRSARYGKGSRWRARYVADDGNEHSKAFAKKAEAQAWLDQEIAAVVGGRHVAPASVARYPSDYVVTSAKTGRCHPVNVQLAVAAARDIAPGLPATVTYHDLRHHFASMLIASGVDIVRVQHRMRHASATTTLRVYGHLLPDADEATNQAVSAAMALRGVSSRDTSNRCA
jgi:integrase